jgi:hypothetical protein
MNRIIKPIFEKSDNFHIPNEKSQQEILLSPFIVLHWGKLHISRENFKETRGRILSCE